VFLPDFILRGRRVVTAHGIRPAAIHVRGGKIIGVVEFENVPDGCPLDDAGTAVVMPGVVDTHVHVNPPWDDVERVTRAAAAGGVTTIVDTAIDRGPATATVAALERKRSAAEGKCFVDVGFWGTLVPGNAREIAPLFEAGILGFACTLLESRSPDRFALSEADLQMIMPALTRIRATLLVHAELARPVNDSASPGVRRWPRIPLLARRGRRYAAYIESRPKAVENDAVGLLIQLCRAHQTRTHIVHLSSADTLAPLFHARAARLPITAETCAHYLTFVADEIPDAATAFKCAPPIRERENREFLWAALAHGLISVVVSAHCAANPEHAGARSGDFLRADDGIAGLELSLPATWTGASARGYTLERVVDWMCRAPAGLAGLSRKGTIDVGFDADMVVFDPDAEFTIERDVLQPSDLPTPYLGRRLRGVVERTYTRGIEVFCRGKKASPQRPGRLLVRSRAV
jgi:allantoinase